MPASQETGTRATLLPFGHLLRRLRLAADLTQEEFAERAGVSTRLISDLERGSIHRPRRDTVQLLADGFGLSGAERESFVALARGRPLVPAPDPAAAAVSPRRPLPAPPTPIVGRLKETAAATALLLRPEVRLLTLTGPGGVGKTRLALEVAARTLVAFPDGSFFVDLAPVRDRRVPLGDRASALVLSAIAHVLGVRGAPEQPIRESLIDWLQGKRLLLVLDNFEHLAAAAPVVAELLAACPELTVLATSRTLLRLRAEREYQVAPLALPSLSDVPPVAELARVPAVDLFVERAESANREFALTDANARAVAEIAVHLDGLPLAIELAAARVRVLSPAVLLARLERRLPLLTGGALDLPTRQQAMRATIDWSHDLLSPDERRLFRRLAVFAGGCTLAAAEAVAGREGDTDLEVLDGLTALVDKSLLRVLDDQDGEHRFGMLETIREYGRECLATAGEEDEIRRRHATWSVNLAERAEPELTGADQERWFARLEIEHDNLRAALSWAIDRGDAETALRLGAALYRFWGTGGHFEEGGRWLEQAMAIDPGVVSAAKGHSLLGAGDIAYFQGDYERASALLEEALAQFRALGDAAGVASSLGDLGLVADGMGDYDRATARYEEAQALFRELGDRTRFGYMYNNLGVIAYLQGQYDRAEALLEESLAVAQELGVRTSVAVTLANLGHVAYLRGDYDRATALQEEALTLRMLGDKGSVAKSFESLAQIATAQRDPGRAARLFGAADALREQIGAAAPPSDRDFNQQVIAEVRAQLGGGAFAAAWAEGATLAMEEAIAYALEDDRPQPVSTLPAARIAG